MAECDTGLTFTELTGEIKKVEGIDEYRTAAVFVSENTNLFPDYYALIDTGKRKTLPFRTDRWPRYSKEPAGVKVP